MVTAGSAALADPVIEGLRRHGREWGSTRECAAALARVLQEGRAVDVVAVRRALRRYRCTQQAARAVARYEQHAAPRRALVCRRLSGRELVAALVSWAERDEGARLEGDLLAVGTSALLRFVALLGDDPSRVVRALRVAGLLESGIAGERGPSITIRIPKGALPDAA